MSEDDPHGNGPSAPTDGGDRTAPATTRVKICGHTREADVAASVAAGADAVGVIADVPVDTPREVGVERAAALLDAVPPLATGVLVTMPETPARAIELVGRTAPDALQVHGSLEPPAVETLNESVDVDVLVAVDADEPDALREYAPAADALLVDSVDDEGGGGTGRTHDWERTREAIADLETPVLLAGGLVPGNVVEAIRTVRPYGVDVASGVEAEDGGKDHDAVRAFVREARAATDRLGAASEQSNRPASSAENDEDAATAERTTDASEDDPDEEVGA